MKVKTGDEGVVGRFFDVVKVEILGQCAGGPGRRGRRRFSPQRMNARRGRGGLMHTYNET